MSSLTKSLFPALNLLAVSVLASGAQAGPVSVGEIARDANGHVLEMSKYDAERYCADRGGLPSIRQLTLALNPDGVSEVRKDGFSRVGLKNEPEFYYSAHTYQRPSGDNGKYLFWSSSISSNLFESTFVFSGDSGRIGPFYYKLTSHQAVRCRR